MKKTNVLFFTRDELIAALTIFYTDILKDTASDIIKEGDCVVPDFILKKGINHLDNEELANVAECLAQIITDDDHSISVVMLYENGKTYLILNAIMDYEKELKFKNYQPKNKHFVPKSLRK